MREVDTEQTKSAYQTFDQDQNGWIDREELQHALQQCTGQVERNCNADARHLNAISTMIHAVFTLFLRRFTPNRRYFTADPLRQALRLENNVKVFNDCDCNGDGQIDYDDFCHMLVKMQTRCALEQQSLVTPAP